VTAVDVRVREALTQPDLSRSSRQLTRPLGPGMWLAPPLTHLAADASYRDDIDRALTMTSRGSVSTPRRWRSVRWCCSRSTPTSTCAGTRQRLVLPPQDHRLGESTIGKILGQLFGAYTER